MKKLLLTTFFVFALSQASFAATSFADLLRQEKASSSFIPKIEVQTVTTEFIDEETEEWTGDNLYESICGPWTHSYDEDQTHDWRLESKSCYNGARDHFKNILSEEIYQNATGDKCQKTRVIIYELGEIQYKECREEYSASQCEANPPEELYQYTCEESTKTVDYEDGKKTVRTYKEIDTCYQG